MSRLLLVWLAALTACTSQFRDLTQTGTALASTRRCGECHVEIYEEWRASAHAASWTNAAFKEATLDYELKECLGCHAPESIFVEDVPGLRPVRRHEGIHCVSCHLSDGKLAGPAPTSALVEPHPVAAREPLYLKADLCGKCHEGTFQEWRKAPVENKRTCQECHMPPVERTLTQGTDALSRFLVGFEKKHRGRRHSFHLGTVARFDGAFDAELDGDILILEHKIPHLVPTGDFGFRRFTIEVVSLDGDGNVIETWRRELFKELGEAMQPLKPRRFAVSLAPGRARARLRLTTAKRTGAATVVHEQVWSKP